MLDSRLLTIREDDIAAPLSRIALALQSLLIQNIDTQQRHRCSGDTDPAGLLQRRGWSGRWSGPMSESTARVQPPYVRSGNIRWGDGRGVTRPFRQLSTSRPPTRWLSKAALAIMGRAGGPTKRPLLPLPAEDRAHLERLLAQLRGRPSSV